MKKFQQNMNRELKRPYPDRRKLESHCISAVAFGSSSATADLLDCPIWVICINVVAIEMLRSKLPSGTVTLPIKTTLSKLKFLSIVEIVCFDFAIV